MEMENKMTREKLYQKLQDRMEEINEYHNCENEEEQEEKYQDLQSSVLSVEVKKEIRILLAWGGPEYGYKLMYSKENEILSGVYYYANWGEYQEVELTEEELDLIDDFYFQGDITAYGY